MPETILVVDDDPHIVELTTLYLAKDGYQVISAADGAQALLKAAHDKPALMVLDLMLPEMDGWEVCRRVRMTSDLPILMLTARDDDIDKIVGLELGADDYLTKPFNPRELVARVKAILRRVEPNPRPTQTQAQTCGNLTIDEARRTVAVDAQRIELRTKEFDLLLVLVENAELVFSREKILDLVWGFDFYGETRTVDVHIAHLRHKLGENCTAKIETVWGVGYRLVSQ